MLWGPYSALIIAVDALVTFVLILLMLRKRKPVTLPANEFDLLSKGGGMLTWIKVRIAGGTLLTVKGLWELNGVLQLPDVNTAIVQALIILGAVSLGLSALTFLFSFIRNKVFPILYIAMISYAVAICALSEDYLSIIVNVVVESLFILYLFRSNKVGIVYGTRPVTTEIASETTAPLSSD